MKTVVSLALCVVAALMHIAHCGKKCHPCCYLDVSKGPGDDEIDRYYFDRKAGVCKQFIYGGCGGNCNNFKTKQECVTKCNPLPTCQQPKDVGTGNKPQKRFYFNSDKLQCEIFIYRGYDGNDNNFKSLAECKRACLHGRCKMPVDKGPCDGHLQKFYHDDECKVCRPFTYGGCKGNANRFDKIEDCKASCGVPVCEQPPCPGPCKGAFKRYFYNSKSGRCETFIYGGCRGNENNFETRKECEKRCCKKASSTVPICEQEKDEGYGDKDLVKFYYDYSTKTCRIFYYKGYGGNQNRFNSIGECMNTCIVSPCDMEKDSGRGNRPQTRYFYNKRTGKCEPFRYYGGGGNRNNFKTRAECEKTCEASSTVPPCEQEKNEGFGDKRLQKFFYDYRTGTCQIFYYKGYGGNQNRFDTIGECMDTCIGKIVPPVPQCEQPKVVGPCKARIPRYFFNTKTGQCEKFTYGGCKGNDNNFECLEDCENACSPCHLKKDSGKGNRPQIRYFYKQTGTCGKFLYFGKGGNKNNFKTLAECEKTCKVFCPKKSCIKCVHRWNRCCADSDCPGNKICCDENCGNKCYEPIRNQTDGVRVPEKKPDCKCPGCPCSEDGDDSDKSQDDDEGDGDDDGDNDEDGDEDGDDHGDNEDDVDEDGDKGEDGDDHGDNDDDVVEDDNDDVDDYE